MDEERIKYLWLEFADESDGFQMLMSFDAFKEALEKINPSGRLVCTNDLTAAPIQDVINKLK